MNMLDSRDHTSNLMSWTGLLLTAKAQEVQDLERMRRKEPDKV